MKKEIKILLISSYLNVFAFALFYPLYAIFVQQMDKNVFVISSSWGVYLLVQGIITIIFGRIEDKLKDKRPIVIVGYFLLSASALGFVFISTVPELYLVQIINALGNGILYPAWKAIYSQSEDKGKEAEEWSLFDGGNLILASVAAIIGGFLVSLSGFKTLFYIIFAIQLLASIYSLRLLKKHNLGK